MTSPLRNVTALPVTSLAPAQADKGTLPGKASPPLAIRDGFETTAVQGPAKTDPVVDHAIRDTSNLFEKILKDFGDGTTAPHFDDPVDRLSYLGNKVQKLIDADPSILDQLRSDPGYQKGILKALDTLQLAIDSMPAGRARDALIEQRQRLMSMLANGNEIGDPGPSGR